MTPAIDVEEARKRVQDHAGRESHTITGLAFAYETNRALLCLSRAHGIHACHLFSICRPADAFGQIVGSLADRGAEKGDSLLGEAGRRA